MRQRLSWPTTSLTSKKLLSNQQWVAGDLLTVADFHLFVFGRLGLRLPTSTRDFPSFPSSHVGDGEPGGNAERNGSAGNYSRRTGRGSGVSSRAIPVRAVYVRFSIAASVKSNLTSFRFSPAFGSALADSVPGGSCFSSRSAPAAS
jgi:hypothetical protein